MPAGRMVVSRRLGLIGRWGRQDSNLCRHSQLVYSQSPLTTRALPRGGAILVAGKLDAEALGHPLVEGGESRHRPHEDGQIGDSALLVEGQVIDSLELELADPRLEAQHNGLLAERFVGVGEVFEGRADVLEDGQDRVAALEAAEQDRAVQLDVLAQRVADQLQVILLDRATERMGLSHSPPPYLD